MVHWKIAWVGGHCFSRNRTARVDLTEKQMFKQRHLEEAEQVCQAGRRAPEAGGCLVSRSRGRIPCGGGRVRLTLALPQGLLEIF